jgi:hypothetical protein
MNTIKHGWSAIRIWSFLSRSLSLTLKAASGQETPPQNFCQAKKEENDMQDTKLTIEYIDIDKLTLYDHNCKIHTEAQIRHIASSIKQFGFNDPIGIWGEKNIILEGNGRLEAMRLIGMKKAPCIRLDHLDEKERRAYIIAHNHLNLQTGFDEKELLRQLEELQGSVDLENLGIDTQQYLTKLTELEKKDLSPYRQVFYLVSMDIDVHDKAVHFIDSLRGMDGVVVDSSMQ